MILSAPKVVRRDVKSSPSLFALTGATDPTTVRDTGVLSVERMSVLARIELAISSVLASAVLRVSNPLKMVRINAAPMQTVNAVEAVGISRMAKVIRSKSFGKFASFEKPRDVMGFTVLPLPGEDAVPLLSMTRPEPAVVGFGHSLPERLGGIRSHMNTVRANAEGGQSR